MQSTVFNNAQMELLDMMSFVDSPEMLAQLKQAISDFFSRRAEEEIDRLWETGALNEQKVEDFRHLHERTPIVWCRCCRCISPLFRDGALK